MALKDLQSAIDNELKAPTVIGSIPILEQVSVFISRITPTELKGLKDAFDELFTNKSSENVLGTQSEERE